MAPDESQRQEVGRLLHRLQSGSDTMLSAIDIHKLSCYANDFWPTAEASSPEFDWEADLELAKRSIQRARAIAGVKQLPQNTKEEPHTPKADSKDVASLSTINTAITPTSLVKTQPPKPTGLAETQQSHQTRVSAEQTRQNATPPIKVATPRVQSTVLPRSFAAPPSNPQFQRTERLSRRSVSEQVPLSGPRSIAGDKRDRSESSASTVQTQNAGRTKPRKKIQKNEQESDSHSDTDEIGGTDLLDLVRSKIRPSVTQCSTSDLPKPSQSEISSSHVGGTQCYSRARDAVQPERKEALTKRRESGRDIFQDGTADHVDSDVEMANTSPQTTPIRPGGAPVTTVSTQPTARRGIKEHEHFLDNRPRDFSGAQSVGSSNERTMRSSAVGTDPTPRTYASIAGRPTELKDARVFNTESGIGSKENAPQLAPSDMYPATPATSPAMQSTAIKPHAQPQSTVASNTEKMRTALGSNSEGVTVQNAGDKADTIDKTVPSSTALVTQAIGTSLGKLPMATSENVWHLLKLRTGVAPPQTKSTRRTDTITLHGFQMQADRKDKEFDVLRVMSDVLHAAFDAARNIVRQPQSISKDEASFGDIHDVMMGCSKLSDPFRGKDIAQQKELVKAFGAIKTTQTLSTHWAESYYWDIIIADANVKIPYALAALEDTVLLEFHSRVLGTHQNMSPQDKSEFKRLWTTLAELRKHECLFIVAYRTKALTRAMRRNKISLADLESWNRILSLLYTTQSRIMKAMYQDGDFRGLDSIPMDFRVPELAARWSSHLGRWQSPSDALEFSKIAGAPLPSNNLLATEACVEFGPLGYQDCNGIDKIALLRLDGDIWSCITTASIAAGTAFGVCPHVTSFSVSPVIGAEHIYACYRNVKYDPLPVIGPLSFVRYVQQEEHANARMASDPYLDPALPNYYSLRIWIIAIRDIGPFQPIKVFRNSAQEVNTSIQNILHAPAANSAKEEEELDQPYGYELRQLGAILSIDYTGGATGVTESDRIRLTARYWTANLAQNASKFIPVSAAGHQMLSKMKHSVEEIDYEALPFVQRFIAQYDAHKEMAEKYWDNRLANITLLEYVKVAVHAVASPTRPKGSNKQTEAVRKALSIPSMSSKSLQAVKPEQCQRGLVMPKGSGHLAVALQIICTIEPLRQLLAGSWRYNWFYDDWNPPFGGPGLSEADLDHQRQAYEACLASLADVVEAMSDHERNAPVEPKMVVAFQRQFNEVLGLRSVPKIDLLAPQDAHEILNHIHGILLDTLKQTSVTTTRPLPAIPMAHITRQAQKIQQQAIAKNSWKLSKQEEHFPRLMGLTVGQLHERYECQADNCTAMRPNTQLAFPLTSELVLYVPNDTNEPISIGELLQLWYGASPAGEPVIEFSPGDLERCPVTGSAPRVKRSCEISLPPEYLLLHIVRAQQDTTTSSPSGVRSTVKNKRAVTIPADMELDLRPIMLEMPANSAQLPSRYQIVATVEHRGDGADDGDYVCLTKRNGRWTFFNRNLAMSCQAEDTRINGANICMVLLNRLQKEFQW